MHDSGCSPLPLTPDPADVLAAQVASRDDYIFGDVHCRGTYPGYFLRKLRELGVQLEITEQDRQDLLYTVDFVSFSYYMSVCETAGPQIPVRAISSGSAQPYPRSF